MIAELQRTLASRADMFGPGTQREAALAELAAVGWPTRRAERWRYTDIGPLTERNFDVAPPEPTAQTIAAAADLIAEQMGHSPGGRIVLLDGRRSTTLETPLPAQLAATTLADASSGSRIATSDHPLAALNTAFTRRGIELRVPDDVRIAGTVEIVLLGVGQNVAPQPRIVVELGRNAELTLVERLLDLPDASGWVNSVTQVTLRSGSRLSLHRLQEHAPAQAHTALLVASVAEGATLSVGNYDLGGRLVRNDIDVQLTEPGARTELFGLFIAGSGRHSDNQTRIDHVAPETQSDEAFRGVVGHRGRGVFNGKVVVRRGAQRIDARQRSDNLLLSDLAEVDAKPELEIYADDVKCSHGATVGELDAEQLFYLRSRGIDETTARELLTTAFAAAVLDRIVAEPVRALVTERAIARLRCVLEEQP